ncbi:uncharacterized protein N7483_008759 [Penicillium malachiteum]|uniref:uncharacterized protein n=1 Tax=Penicillium malachiteum TaxID=1324776 RepID=UPI002547EE47|nr:uncharacterized protein N7483_008759 [Penicillium malachiteum]KAJ5720825.1 hypothetical protein N7483_008759 [Penicillium malachiteum]
MPPSNTRPRKKKNARKPLQRAKITQLATDTQKSQNSVDQKILDRIQKCLARAYHANSSEGEAKAALFLSQKLMSQHNVTQADIMKDDNTKSHYGGQSVVEVRRTDGNKMKKAVQESFVEKLTGAMCTFFDCKLYVSDLYDCIEWTFYGIAPNTVAAAKAFEMTHNQISVWACEYKGGTPSFSYRLGVADGLVAMANREKDKELQAAKRKELEYQAVKKEEAQKQSSQTSPFTVPPPPTPSSDKLTRIYEEDQSMGDINDPYDGEMDANDGFGFDCDVNSGIQMDFSAKDIETIDLRDDDDDIINRLMKRDPVVGPEVVSLDKIPEFKAEPEVPVKSEPAAQSVSDVSPWESSMQLVQFRQTADQVATDYLSGQGIKLSRASYRGSTAIRDGDAYREGQRDSLKIDVRNPEMA